MAGIPFTDVDYCQYATWGYQKPTRIWGSPHVLGFTPKTCDFRNCANLADESQFRTRGRHKIHLSGPTQNLPRHLKYRIPEALVLDIALAPSPQRDPVPPRPILKPRSRLQPVSEEETGQIIQPQEAVPVPADLSVVDPVSRPKHQGAQDRGNRRKAPVPMEIPTCLLREVTETADNQLLLMVPARGQDGQLHPLQILIDTGAVVNLIRRDRLPPAYFRPSRRPLALATADGSRMRGGAHEARLELVLQADRELPQGGTTWSAPASFHDADIQVDALIGYPWLQRHKLGVFPHLRALALETRGIFLLLRGESSSGLETELPEEKPSAPTVLPDLRLVDEVRAMQLALPWIEGNDDEEEPDLGEESLREDEDVQEEVARVFLESASLPPSSAQGIVVVPPGEQATGETVDRLRAAIRKDYEGRVLRDQIWFDKPPRGPFGEGRIELKPGTVPKKQHAIRLTGERHKALCDMVEEWERDGKVEPGQSAWSSPTFVVAKKGGKWRGVVDFRAPNEATVTDAHPLPRIEDILVGQGRRYVFSVLDLKDAFHQVPLHPDSRPYTCCSTLKGTMQWCVVVMGLKMPYQFFTGS